MVRSSKQEKPGINRGAALWGNLVIAPANWPAGIFAADKETGRLVWETNMTESQRCSALLPRRLPSMIASSLALPGATAACVTGWQDSMRRPASYCGVNTPFPPPANLAARPGRVHNNAWQTGGAAVWVTGTYDPDTNQTYWGTGNPVPMFDPTYRPGDNLYTNSAISWNPDTGNMNWYFQYTPGDMWDYDEVGTHILIDGSVAGQPRKLITHSARNGFLYTIDRFNGQIVAAKPYMDNVNWTKGIDQKTGKPVDYDPAKDIQTYAGIGNLTPGHRSRKSAPPLSAATTTGPAPIAAEPDCSTSRIDGLRDRRGRSH